MRAWRIVSSMRIGRRRGGAIAATAEMLSIIAADMRAGELEIAVAALLRRHDQARASASLPRWPLAVCGVTCAA